MGVPPHPSPGDGPRPALRLAMLVVLYAIPALTAVRPIADPVLDSDVWWHLRVGQWVCEHRTVPANDPFTLYGRERPWVAYSWLFEVALYALYSWLGLAAVIVYRVALSLAVTAALHRLVAQREPRFLVATLLTGIGVATISVLFDERPWLFTILFTTLTLDIILDIRDGRPNRMLWLLPVFYALWANLHIQFVYGLGVLGLACMAPVADRLLHRDNASRLGSSGYRRLLLLTNLCLLATLLNPYHIRLYGVVVEYATQPGPFHLINELKALEFRGPYDWSTLALTGAAAFVLGRRKRLGSFDILLLISSAYFAFRARRRPLVRRRRGPRATGERPTRSRPGGATVPLDTPAPSDLGRRPGRAHGRRRLASGPFGRPVATDHRRRISRPRRRPRDPTRIRRPRV